MAQLYKMTLYVCDLEENLSLDEIECLISERALNGISVNSVCHFADEQIGEQVEWDDDIDLNKRSCPTSTWDKYFKPPIQPQTNADRIRAMSDRELAHFLAERNVNESTLLLINENHGLTAIQIEALKHSIYCALVQWLQQPAEDGV